MVSSRGHSQEQSTRKKEYFLKILRKAYFPHVNTQYKKERETYIFFVIELLQQADPVKQVANKCFFKPDRLCIEWLLIARSALTCLEKESIHTTILPICQVVYLHLVLSPWFGAIHVTTTTSLHPPELCDFRRIKKWNKNNWIVLCMVKIIIVSLWYIMSVGLAHK